MPLKYGMRIRFANCCNCIWYYSYSPRHLMFHRRFFSTRDTLSALVGSEVNAAAFHGAIMTLQFFQLTLFIIVYCFGDSCRVTDAFDDSVNCNVSGTDVIIVPSNLLIYIQVICPSTDLYNFQTFAAVQFSICIPVLLRLYCADHPTRREIF